MPECTDIRELLSLYLISELDSGQMQQVREHLSSCESCGKELDILQKDMDRISSEIHNLKDDPGIEVRIKEAVHVELNTKAPALSRWSFIAPSAAAALLIIAAILFFTPSGPRAMWEQDLGKLAKGDGSVAVYAGENLYIVFTEKNTAYAACVDSETGFLNWRREHPGIRGIAADEQGLYAVEYVRGRPELQSFQSKTGEVMWSFAPEKRSALTSALDQSHPALSGTAVFWRWGDTVYAVARRDGKELWSFSAEEGAVPEPVLKEDLVFTAAGNTVYALSAETGEPVYTEKVFLGEDTARISSVTRDGDNLYYSISARDNSHDRVLCFNSEKRETQWISYAPSIQHVQVLAGKILVRGDGLYALDPADGKTVWNVKAEGCSPVTLVKGRFCYFDSSSKDSFVYLDPRTGNIKGRYELDGSCTGIAVSGNTGYVIASSGMLYKISF